MTPRKRTRAAADVPAGEMLQASAHLEAPLWVGAAVADVRRYLEETGLALEDVLAAHNLENTPNFPHARERLTEEELAAVGELGSQLIAIERWARLVGRVGLAAAAPEEAPARPDYLPEAEGAAVLESLAALPPFPLGASGTTPEPPYRELEKARLETVALLAEVSPTYRAALERREALDAKARLSPAELRERLAARLTRPDGRQAPSPAEWCAAKGADLAAFRQALFVEWFTQYQAKREDRRKRPAMVRVGTAPLGTFNADKHAVRKATRKNPDTTPEVDAEKRRLFLTSEYRRLGVYEKLVLVSLANLAWDQGLLDGVPAAASAKRIVDLSDLATDANPQYLRFRFPGYAEVARRVGAKPDAEGRIPQHYTRNLERAFQKLSKEARWIPEPVRVRPAKGQRWRDDVLVRQALWVEIEALVESGDVLVKLHPAAVTSMLASWVEHENLLEHYESARKQIGARQLRDDFVACEDYLLQLRNANEAQHARTETPAADATEADRRVLANVSKAKLWERMGWDKEAKKRGKRHAQKLERDALAFCKARGLLLDYRERPGQKGPVLDLELRGSRHPDPDQGTLFLPGGGL